MTVRLDVRPRPVIVLGPPVSARPERARVSGWVGGYWLLAVGLAALCYFDVIPVVSLIERAAAGAGESRPVFAGALESDRARSLGLASSPGSESGERIGTTEPFELSRAAYRGVHYGGGEESDPSSLADRELALLAPEAPLPESPDGLGSRPSDAASDRSLAIGPRDRSDRRRAGVHRRSRRSSREEPPTSSPLVEAPPSARHETAGVATLPSVGRSSDLDDERARIAALSRAVDSALGRSLLRPRPDTSDDEVEPAPTGAAGRWQRASSGSSCEGAAASYREEIRIGAEGGPPDVSREQYARVLNRGSYFRHCGAPASMGIRICAAVQNGRALGVTVWTDPGDSSVGSCVAAAVRGLSFPSHPRLDVTTTTFAPVR